jgi:hypothetical protein
LERPEVIADTLGALVTRPAIQLEQWDVEPEAMRPEDQEIVMWSLGARRTHYQHRLYVNGATYCLSEAETLLIEKLMSLELCPWVELVEHTKTQQGLELLNRLWDRQLLIRAQNDSFNV